MKFQHSIFACVVLAVLASCSPAHKFSKAHDPSSIPSDLKKDGHVLLVINQEEGMFKGTQNRRVEREMKRHYNGAFEMVSWTDIAKNPKYDDLEKYRYAICRNDTGPRILTALRVEDNPAKQRRYLQDHIFDRKQNEFLPTMGYFSPAYAMGMEAFAKFMKNK
jgi:hypothetical protein